MPHKQRPANLVLVTVQRNLFATGNRTQIATRSDALIYNGKYNAWQKVVVRNMRRIFAGCARRVLHSIL